MNALALTAGLLLLGAPAEGDTPPRPAAATVEETAPAKPAQAVATEDDFELHPIEQRLIDKTNRERVRHGLQPLRPDRRLIQSARRHCAWMCNTGVFAHTSAPVAENIAMGQTSPQQAIQSWMNSSGHRANMLSAGHTRIGVAAYKRPNGQVYWVQQFQR